MRRCPPGVFCITHMSLIFAILAAMYVLYLYNQAATSTSHEKLPERQVPNPTVILTTNGYPGPVADPAVPPLRYPSNNFTQQGILKSKREPNNLLPLMGKIIHRSRDTWTYYTFKDGNNLMKLR